MVHVPRQRVLLQCTLQLCIWVHCLWTYGTWIFQRISSQQACLCHQALPMPCYQYRQNIDCPTRSSYKNDEGWVDWGGPNKFMWERRNLPLHIQGTILLPQIAPTTFNMSFCPLYPCCENCCVQCHKLLRNRAPTANALDQRPLALFWMDRFCSKAQSKLWAMHQMLSSISGWKYHSLFEGGLPCPLLHWW